MKGADKQGIGVRTFSDIKLEFTGKCFFQLLAFVDTRKHISDLSCWCKR